jgi:hypothetical protein
MQEKSKNTDDMSADERIKEVAKILGLAIKRRFSQSSNSNKESLNTSYK